MINFNGVEDKNSKLVSLIYHLYFIYIIVYSFVILNQYQIALKLTMLGLPLLFVLYLVLHVFYRIKIRFELVLINSLLLFISFFSGIFYGLNISHFSSIIVINLVVIMDIYCVKINPFVEKILFYLATVFVIYQLSRFNWGLRRVLSYGDPNVSSYYLLMIIFWAYKRKSWFLLPFCSFPLLSLSRNLFFALIVLIIVGFLKKPLSKLIDWFGVFKFSRAFFFSVVLLLFIGFYFQQKVTVSNAYEGGVERLLSVTDGSNEMRFMANSALFNLMFTDSKLIIGGFGKGDNFADAMKEKAGIKIFPHNSFFEFIGVHGVLFSFFYFLVVFKVLNRRFTYKDFEIMAAYIFFISFLFTGFRNMYLLIFLAIINLDYTDLEQGRFFRRKL